MLSRTQLPLQITFAALTLGILADGLLRATPWGLNFTVWVSAFIGTLAILTVVNRVTPASEAFFLTAASLNFAAAFAFRASPVLLMLNLVGLIVALAVARLTTCPVRVRLARIEEYVAALVLTAQDVVLGFPETIRRAELPSSSARSAARLGRSAVAGVLLTLPPLVLFGELLVSADAAFEQALVSALALNPANILTHGILIVVFTWLSGGYLRGAFFPHDPTQRLALQVAPPRLGVIEVGMPLAALSLLFSVFIAFQFRYLFGDHTLVETTTGLTYAEYARRGFFQLVAVVALALPVLLLADWALTRGRRNSLRVYRGLAGLFVALLFLIMLSALRRMQLYQSVYGLTELRVYATVFMLWLGVVLVLFVATVLNDRGRHFAFGSLVSGLAFVAALNAINVDALIVKTNLERADVAGREFDTLYASSLSADAVPALIAGLTSLSREERCRVADLVLNRWLPPEKRDWRTWNHSRARARRLVAENRDYLQKQSCQFDRGS